MKQGITITREYDHHDRSVVRITKRRGKLTLEEVSDLLRTEGWGEWNGYYAIVLNCSEGTLGGNGLYGYEEPKGDALEALRLDPRAVALNGYYLGRFGDMTIDDIAAGIRWHYENGTNALADDDILAQARADIEAARQTAAEAGLPFSERLVVGSVDQPNPYTYDGSMTPEDYEAMQRARGAHAALVEVAADRFPDAAEEAIERIAEVASSMKLSPEAVQRILDAFDNIIEVINRMIEWAVWAAKTIVNTIGRAFDDFLLCRAPPKWRHYALHAKRARVRKKYRNRIRRAFFAALASEGGGSS